VNARRIEDEINAKDEYACVLLLNAFNVMVVRRRIKIKKIGKWWWWS